MPKHLASYDFRGDRWSLDLDADSVPEAQARIEAMRRSLVYDGEVFVTIAIPTGWLARLRRWMGGRDA